MPPSNRGDTPILRERISETFENQWQCVPPPFDAAGVLSSEYRTLALKAIATRQL
jgi:hypothetical protein